MPCCCGALAVQAFLQLLQFGGSYLNARVGQVDFTPELVPASSWSAGRAAALSHAKAAEACLNAWERRVAAFLLRAKTRAPLVFLSSLCTSLHTARRHHLPA